MGINDFPAIKKLSETDVESLDPEEAAELLDNAFSEMQEIDDELKGEIENMGEIMDQINKNR